MTIDINFDFRTDTPAGKDPDSCSPRLRAYHKLLWSKPLPSGELFQLDDTGSCYLHHSSTSGEFCLSSDTVIPAFARERRIAEVLEEIATSDIASFNRLGYTMGGMMLFPANRLGRRMTINGARGFNPRIKDRFDLTVECIRRHYAGERSPLAEVIARYASFFALFRDFNGYVEHFLLQDVVTSDCSAVRFFIPFHGFQNYPVPRTADEYRVYRQRAMEFLAARNQRITHSARDRSS